MANSAGYHAHYRELDEIFHDKKDAPVIKTCTVTVRVLVGNQCEYGYEGKPADARVWERVNIMDTSRTRAWATRQFNQRWQHREKDQHIRVEWECRYHDDSMRFSGSLSGVNNIKLRRGVFE